MSVKTIITALLTISLLFPILLPAQNLSRQARHLKDFEKCFSADEASSEKLAIINRVIAEPPCFRLSLISNFSGYLLLAFFPRSFSDQLRECYYSQGAIRGAIEMYNAENVLPLRRINSDLINNANSPLMPEYLKYPFPKPSSMCQYDSIGDITRGNLIIYCRYHGAPQRTLKDRGE